MSDFLHLTVCIWKNQTNKKKNIVIKDFTFMKVATSPLFFTWLSWVQVLLTLLGAGAAYIQNNVLLGVNSDKISAFKGQMTSWGVDKTAKQV